VDTRILQGVWIHVTARCVDTVVLQGVFCWDVLRSVRTRIQRLCGY